MEINGIEPPLGPQEVHDGSVLDDTRAQVSNGVIFWKKLITSF